jgi:hypothetical protein
MTAQTNPSTDRATQFRELLLRYLLAAGLPDWPSADGMTLDEVVKSYPQYAACGRVPDKDLLLLCHAELREEINRFFTTVAE